MIEQVAPAHVDRDRLRAMIQQKYTEVAQHPEVGFHFHTGRPLAEMLGYDMADVDWLPSSTVDSFAGTGNPWSLGRLREGEVVLLGSARQPATQAPGRSPFQPQYKKKK